MNPEAPGQASPSEQDLQALVEILHRFPVKDAAALLMRALQASQAGSPAAPSTGATPAVAAPVQPAPAPAAPPAPKASAEQVNIEIEVEAPVVVPAAKPAAKTESDPFQIVVTEAEMVGEISPYSPTQVHPSLPKAEAPVAPPPLVPKGTAIDLTGDAKLPPPISSVPVMPAAPAMDPIPAARPVAQPASRNPFAQIPVLASAADIDSVEKSSRALRAALGPLVNAGAKLPTQEEQLVNLVERVKRSEIRTSRELVAAIASPTEPTVPSGPPPAVLLAQAARSNGVAPAAPAPTAASRPVSAPAPVRPPSAGAIPVRPPSGAIPPPLASRPVAPTPSAPSAPRPASGSVPVRPPSLAAPIPVLAPVLTPPPVPVTRIEAPRESPPTVTVDPALKLETQAAAAVPAAEPATDPATGGKSEPLPSFDSNDLGEGFGGFMGSYAQPSQGSTMKTVAIVAGIAVAIGLAVVALRWEPKHAPKPEGEEGAAAVAPAPASAPAASPAPATAVAAAAPSPAPAEPQVPPLAAAAPAPKAAAPVAAPAAPPTKTKPAAKRGHK